MRALRATMSALLEVVTMRKLLSADFSRLFKSSVFYILALFIILFAGFRLLNIASDPSNSPDDGLFIYAVVMGVIMAVFVSLYVGTEHSCHTIRNKLIAGHTRINIYLSNYIVCTVAGWILCSLYCVASLALGRHVAGVFKAEAADIIATILCIYLLTAVYAGIFVLLVMIYTNYAAAAVACVLLALATVILGINVMAKLQEPEKIEIMEYTVDGEEAQTELEDNPKYVSNETVRRIYETINDVLPGGQSIQVSGMINEISRPPARFYVYDIIIILFTCGLGVMIFGKKDLK